MIAWHEVALASGWAGFLALERRAFLQAMLSRPLVAATSVAWLMGDIGAGLAIGMVLELYYLGAASLGAAIPDHDTLAATGTAAAAAAMAHAGNTDATPAIWSLSLVLFSGLGKLGRWLDRLLERYSGRLVQTAVILSERDELDQAMRLNLWAMWPHFVLFGGLTALCAGIGHWVGRVFDAHLLPTSGGLRLLRGLAWAYPAMASVAAAVAARGSRSKHAFAWAGSSAAAVVGAATLWALWGRR